MTESTRAALTTRSGSTRPPHYVQSLERGLAVIRAFDAEHPQLTLTEVAERTGLTRAATRRFLLTLSDLGFVRANGRLFSLTPRVLELGYAYLSSQTLPELAEPHLECLVAEVRETGEPVRLEPMDPYERKMMHDLVMKTGGVRSESEGSEPKRRVVIHPEG
jgi:hypothetical protein